MDASRPAAGTINTTKEFTSMTDHLTKINEPVQEPGGFVTSQDGTEIHYRQYGQGPGLVVLHGAMETGQSHAQLAQALASQFTVTLPDRRGRGLSESNGKDYNMRKEIEDLEALLRQTGSRIVFGVSSGALICLQAALELSSIQKMAIFEPPLFFDRSFPTAVLRQCDAQLAQGKLDGALVTGMKGAQMGPPIFNRMPDWLLRVLVRPMIASEEKKAGPGEMTMLRLAPTLHNDFSLAVEMSETLERFRSIALDVFLLGGSQSPAYLKDALDALEKTLPSVQRVEFAGLNHGASGNTDRGGRPDLVAAELRRFFCSID
jgi:pimeloyl-ACP methyl ester carboxylesterase